MRNKRLSARPPFLKEIVFQRQQTNTQEYPLSLPLFQKDFKLEFQKPITILTGDNGSGKSTFLECIAHACGFNIQGGSRDHEYSTHKRELLDYLDKLSGHLKLSWLPKIYEGFFMRAETFFNFLEYIHNPEWSDLEIQYGGNLLQKSHGESFLTFFVKRLNRGGLYLLDEPEAALSPMRQLEFLKILQRIENTHNAQVIMVTHSSILMGYPTADLYSFGLHGLRKIDLEETEHFLLMKEYVKNPRGYIKDYLEAE